MALPNVQLGVAYPIDLSDLLRVAEASGPQIGINTYHTITYTPDSQSQKGTPVAPIDTSKKGQLMTTPARTGPGNSVELSFANTAGEICTFSGGLQPSRNECALVFNGTSFTLKQVSSSALSMKEIKRQMERKRPAESGEELPDPKRTKFSEPTRDVAMATMYNPATTSPSSSDTLSTASTVSASSINFSLAKPKNGPSGGMSALSAPITPVVPIATKEVTVEKPLTKSMEMRQATLDEPDSDDSDDSE